MRFGPILWTIVIGVMATKAAFSGCIPPVADSRVIYGKSTEKPGSSILFCRGFSQSESRVDSGKKTSYSHRQTDKSTGEQTQSANLRTDREKILTQEILRTKEQLKLRMSSSMNSPGETAVIRRLELDLDALKRELERLGRTGS
jgi:hypothetical protein